MTRLLLLLGFAAPAMRAELLHNGIVLPPEWPPRSVGYTDLLAQRPPTPPYLRDPPAVIGIDVGRQLFVDDFLVLQSNATRTFHRAVFRRVVLEPLRSETRAQVRKYSDSMLGFARVASARPFSGGVSWDDSRQRFVMHYRCAYTYTRRGLGCVAYSEDGLRWIRPVIRRTLRNESTAPHRVTRPPKMAPKLKNHRALVDNAQMWRTSNAQMRRTSAAGLNSRRLAVTIKKGVAQCALDGLDASGRLQPNALPLANGEAFTAWLDHDEPVGSPDRWKILVGPITNSGPSKLLGSADGENWEARGSTATAADRISFFRDPFRSRWVFSIRENLCRGGHGHLRISRYWDSLRFFGGGDWSSKWLRSYFQCTNAHKDEPVHWAGVDGWDCGGRNVKECGLYHLDATPYESVMIGQMGVLHPGFAHGGCKTTHVHAAFSRDGFHWSRTDASGDMPRVPLVDDPLGLRYIQPIAGNFLVHGDEIFVYYGGATACRRCNVGSSLCTEGGDARVVGATSFCNSSMSELTALAVLRRDGFASLDAGAQRAVITTRPLLFKTGLRLFVNVDATNGQLRAAILLPGGREAPGFELQASQPLSRVNSTRVFLNWKRGADVSRLAGKVIQLRFELTMSQLYSFWLSPNENGESGGFVNGPGIKKGRDCTACAPVAAR
mmetsp:Transcript_24679/g.58269  ORF Transcript_24679/g.58269 Transcript_24679/m.58269 type:complete len:665 (+) Transcript_24679:185-2179(+)